MSTDEQIISLLEEAVRWLRFQGLEKAKAAVSDQLDTEKKKQVFDLTDGKNSITTIAEKMSVSTSTVFAWWTEWYAAGILTKADGKFRHLFRLSEIGIRSDPGEKSTRKVKR